MAGGMLALQAHLQNYDSTGASVRKLQLLWWEFPPEHWDALREGSRMGFLTTPESIMHENAEMDEEQTRVASQFVDELLEIGAVGPPPEGCTPVTNTPLFCIKKAFQEGEWRVIADCKAGGQNEHIGNDPVYLNRPLHILEQMYTGGFTAVADASKFFYQFPVHPDDQKYLGLIHPSTGKLYTWWGCPMGSGSSPGLAGRYGLAFVRLLRERSSWFAQSGRANCWWTGLREEGYDPAHGYGFRLERADGGPAVKIWIFVDDFAIHGPDYESTAAALRAFLDLTLWRWASCVTQRNSTLPARYNNIQGSSLTPGRTPPFVSLWPRPSGPPPWWNTSEAFRRADRSPVWPSVSWPEPWSLWRTPPQTGWVTLISAIFTSSSTRRGQTSTT